MTDHGVPAEPAAEWIERAQAEQDAYNALVASGEIVTEPETEETVTAEAREDSSRYGTEQERHSESTRDEDREGRATALPGVQPEVRGEQSGERLRETSSLPVVRLDEDARALRVDADASLSASSSPDSGHSSGDEWCPGHGSFSERRLKSDCVICRGEYMPEQTVSAGAKVLADDEVCSCLDETGERRVRLYERCERCGAFMAGAGQVPADIEQALAEMIETAAVLNEALRQAVSENLLSVQAEGRIERARAAFAAVRTPEEKT